MNSIFLKTSKLFKISSILLKSNKSLEFLENINNLLLYSLKFKESSSVKFPVYSLVKKTSSLTKWRGFPEYKLLEDIMELLETYELLSIIASEPITVPLHIYD